MPNINPKVLSKLIALALLASSIIPVGSSYAYALIDLNIKADSSSEVSINSTTSSDESSDESSLTDAVVVRYKERGRFLALVPITFTVMAIARADGTVELIYPWYSKFTIDKQDEIETRVKIAVDNAMRAQTVGSVRAEGEAANPAWDDAQSANITQAIETSLRAFSDSEITVD